MSSVLNNQNILLVPKEVPISAVCFYFNLLRKMNNALLLQVRKLHVHAIHHDRDFFYSLVSIYLNPQPLTSKQLPLYMYRQIAGIGDVLSLYIFMLHVQTKILPSCFKLCTLSFQVLFALTYLAFVISKVRMYTQSDCLHRIHLPLFPIYFLLFVYFLYGLSLYLYY